jgi:diguanylate cyclase (GGDEF)-like protein
MKRSSLFPEGDVEQGLRFRRYLIAAATSALLVALLVVYYLEGVLPRAALVVASGATFAGIIVFYALFRTGWNRKAKDPSLTVPMMLTAATVVNYAMYHAAPTPSSLLLLYPVIMFFGVFRLDTCALLLVALYLLVGYALALNPPWGETRTIARPGLDIVDFVVLAAALLWFAVMGGYVHDLRRRARWSEFDWLTRSYNRKRILELLRAEKIRCDRGGGPLCVCMVDMDRFKNVNDTFGHHAGDAVLQAFVKLALGELRAIDSLGRYGGEEFLLILPATSMAGARDCAERVRRRVERAEFPKLDARCRVTVSIGIAQYRPGEDIAETLQRADAELYRAKHGGRNSVRGD